MKKTNVRLLPFHFIAVCAIGFVGLPSLKAQLLSPYIGGDGTLWSGNGSWASGLPADTVDNVSLRSDTTSTGSVFDLADGFTITGLSAASRSLDSSDSSATHTINLNSQTLNVVGNLYVGEATAGGDHNGSLTLRNGTLSLSDGAVRVGYRTGGTTGLDATGVITAGAGLTFNSSNLSALYVGYQNHQSGFGNGTIDFSGIAAGTLNVAGGTDNIYIGGRVPSAGSGSGPTGTVTLGNNWTSTTFGSDSVRADFRVAYRTGNGQAVGSFTQSGGTFTADLNNWDVAYNPSGNDTPTTTGTINLTGVTAVDINANVLNLATRTSGNGTITLSTGNVLVNTSTTIGGGTKGTLNLNRTDFAVGSAATLTLGTTGEINSTIGSVSAGIVIANTSPVALVISNTAQVSNTRGLEINFEANPLGVDWIGSATGADGIFYGFKWAGNKVVTLDGIRNGTDNIIGNADDTLVWNQTGLTGQFANKAVLFYDGTGPGTLNTDATYIGFYTVIPEPSSSALLILGVGALVSVRRRRTDSPH